MVLGYKEMLARAEAVVTSVTVDEVAARGEDIVLVDIRDVRELEREGMIGDAIHAPRGMLEFWIDPESPYHKPVFAQDKTYIFYCASGWRSLLAAETAQAMGLKAQSMHGGFTAWKTSGKPVAERKSRDRQ